MANGTSGDINNINFRQPRPRQKPYEQMRYVAHDVAGEGAGGAGGAEVQRRRHARRPLSRADAEVAASDRRAARLGQADGRRRAEGRSAGPTCRLSMPSGRCGWPNIPKRRRVPLQALRIGDVCIGTMPCEVFCEIGLEFKRRSPQQPAFMVELNHGYFGYLADAAAAQAGRL